MFFDAGQKTFRLTRKGEGPGPDGMRRLDERGRWYNGWRYSPEWRWGRDGGTDVNGNRQSSDSWSADRTIITSADEGTALRLKVWVRGQRGRNGRCRPHMWGASLYLGRSYIFTGSGNCKSVKEALRKADAALTDKHIEQIRHIAYFRPVGMRCIFRKEEDGTFKPFATNLGIDAHDSKNWRPLGHGDFVVAYQHYERREDGSREAQWNTHQTDSMGMSGRFSKDPPPETQGLEPWFPEPPDA